MSSMLILITNRNYLYVRVFHNILSGKSLKNGLNKASALLGCKGVFHSNATQEHKKIKPEPKFRFILNPLGDDYSSPL